MEQTIINIIILSGEARSCAMEAIRWAKHQDFEKAKDLLLQANDKLRDAHAAQTGLIQAEAGGKKYEVSLLMVHAQDHLMTAITVRDLAGEIVELYTKL